MTPTPPLFPVTPQPKKPRNVWKWIVIGLVVIVGGCSALVVSSVNKAVNDLNREQREHAITRAEFDAVPLGSTQAAVIDQLGKPPQDTQDFEHQGIDNVPIQSSCIYYNLAGGEFGDAFQFCFEDDALRSKNAY